MPAQVETLVQRGTLSKVEVHQRLVGDPGLLRELTEVRDGVGVQAGS